MEAQNAQPEPAPSEGSSEIQVEYAGFWIRFLAFVLDSVLIMMVILPLLFVFYDMGDLLTAGEQSPGLAYEVIVRVLPIIAVLVFWRYRAATPGKIMMDIYIVDADTLRQPPFGRLLLRYLGYYVSILTLFLGFLWIGWDKRKQGFHDKIAKTLVIKKVAGQGVRVDNRQELQGKQADGEVSEAPTASDRDPWKE